MCVCVCVCVCERARLTLGLAGTQLAGQAPAFARHLAAAALGLGGVEGLGHGALPRLELSEAEALPGVCSETETEAETALKRCLPAQLTYLFNSIPCRLCSPYSQGQSQRASQAIYYDSPPQRARINSLN